MNQDSIIRLESIDEDTFNYVVEYCTYLLSTDKDKTSDDTGFENEFCRRHEGHLDKLALAASQLGIDRLVEITTRKLREIVEFHEPEEIAQILGIECDFTPEERREAYEIYEMSKVTE